MKFTIAGKEYELKFGMKFIRQLDIANKIDYQGMELGMGLHLTYMGLLQYNPVVISDIIKAAVSHEENVKIRDVDKAIEQYAEDNDGLDELFVDLKEELGKSKIVKATLKHIEQNARVQQPGV